jgi:uncharacterized protein YkwD
MKRLMLSVLAVAAMAFPAFAAEGLQAEKTVTTKVEAKVAAPVAKTPTKVEAEFTLTEAEQAILNSVNAARAARGLLPLKADPILTQRARNHAAVMHARGMFHSRGAWENIAKGQATPLGAFRTWMGSSGHYANMMSRRATHIGIGVSNYSYVQQFSAAPITGTPAPTAAKAESCSKGNCGTVTATVTAGGRVRGFLNRFRLRGCRGC